MTKPLIGCRLQAVVVAVRAGVELRDRTKSRVLRLAIGKRRKAAFAYGLIAVHLGLVGLVYRARADVLSAQIDGAARFDARGRSSIA